MHCPLFPESLQARFGLNSATSSWKLHAQLGGICVRSRLAPQNRKFFKRRSIVTWDPFRDSRLRSRRIIGFSILAYDYCHALTTFCSFFNQSVESLLKDDA